MATHSSTLAWKIPWTEEPGRLQSMRSLRVGDNWVTSLSLFTFMHWRRKWQPTPVFLPGESQGWGSLVGCSPWGRRVGHDWSNLVVSMVYICQSQSHSSSPHHSSPLVSIQLFSISVYSWTLITWIVKNKSLPKVMINYYIIYHLFYCNSMNYFYALYMICLLSSTLQSQRI